MTAWVTPPSKPPKSGIESSDINGRLLVGDQEIIVYNDSQVVQDVAEQASQLAQITTNVKSFGAKGDGVTDDTLSVQNAINSLSGGGSVFFPKGKYLVDGNVLLKSNISLIGVGRNESTIYKTTSGDLFTATDLKNITVEGLGFERNNVGNGLFAFKRTDYITINKIKIVGLEGETYSEGISARECNYVFITNSIFQNTRGHSVVVGTQTLSPEGSCETLIIDNCIFEGYGTSSTGMGLDVSGGKYSDGTYEYVKNVQITNCTFRNGVRNGLKIQIVEDCVFRNNIISNNGEIGLILNGQDRLLKNIIVEGNIFNNNGTAISFMSLNPSDKNNVSIDFKNNKTNNSVLRCLDFPTIVNGYVNVVGNSFNEPNVIAIRLDIQSSGDGHFNVQDNDADCTSFVVRFHKKTTIKNNRAKCSFKAIYDLDSSNTYKLDEVNITDNIINEGSTNIDIARLNIGKLIIKNNNQTTGAGAYNTHIDGTNGVVNIDVLLIVDNTVIGSATASIRVRNVTATQNQCARNTVDKLISIDNETAFNVSENLVF